MSQPPQWGPQQPWGQPQWPQHQPYRQPGPPPKKGLGLCGFFGIVALCGFGGCVALVALAPKGPKSTKATSAPEPEKPKTAAEKRRGDKPNRSGWDGGVYPVKSYLTQRMNDPDSFEWANGGCTDPTASGDFWVTSCSYRGNNAFGAKVLNANTFYIQNGEVVKAD